MSDSGPLPEADIRAGASSSSASKVPAQDHRSRGFTTARRITVAIPVLLLVLGLVTNTGTGTLSSFGIRDIATICPLGVLETMLATWSAIPRWIIVLVVFAITVTLFGRAFCAWLCPVPPLSSLGRRTNTRTRHGQPGRQNGRRHKVDSRHAVLLGVLASSAVFGFPVFCLVCPIGLSFATIICVWRAFQFAEVSWGLLAFPVLVGVEVVLFRKWCGWICPLGALMSLIGQGNRTFQPQVDRDLCLEERGQSCLRCTATCPEQLDVQAALRHPSDFAECTRCGACVQACPAQALAVRLSALEKPEP